MLQVKEWYGPLEGCLQLKRGPEEFIWNIQHTEQSNILWVESSQVECYAKPATHNNHCVVHWDIEKKNEMNLSNAFIYRK